MKISKYEKHFHIGPHPSPVPKKHFQRNDAFQYNTSAPRDPMTMKFTIFQKTLHAKFEEKRPCTFRKEVDYVQMLKPSKQQLIAIGHLSDSGDIKMLVK